MPIILDDIDFSKTTKVAAISPKFFSSKLTGCGKKQGLLNEHLKPVNNATSMAHRITSEIRTKTSSSQSGISTSYIPMAPLRPSVLVPDVGLTLPVPHVDDRFELELAGSRATTHEAYFDMSPQACVVTEDSSGETTKRSVIIQYRMELHLVALGVGTPQPERSTLVKMSHTTSSPSNVTIAFDDSPMTQAGDFIDASLSKYALTWINQDMLIDWMGGYLIHDRITRAAQCWASMDIADEISAFVREMGVATSRDANLLSKVAHQLRYLENYNVPLEGYRKVGHEIKTHFPNEQVLRLAKQNLSLLMNYTLDHLEQIKPQLATPGTPQAGYQVPNKMSQQQSAALTTREPLIMTQAGAGTGKSTVILERINYLQACGVDAGDITVLSFTNAAADNIIAKAPMVNSMTIARMVNDIYQLNYPDHGLSSIETIINSLEIFFPNDAFAIQFQLRLKETLNNDISATTALNTFIELHFDEVIAALSTIGQTSLELEIIICYQQIDTMIEPAHIQCRHLIIDEVQDNSIFEFIYLLKYVSKHQQSMFIVGDASQTLYEFRAANPRALNTLEGSGVFTTYKLTTNYRSNQEILDFANVVLGGLETNQIAGIQLQANSLTMPTVDTFQEKVKLHYEHTDKYTGFISDDLPALMNNVVVPQYLTDCLARGEQIAFLAFSRKDVASMQLALSQAYPHLEVASLVADRVLNTDVFSQYIKHHWNDVRQVKPRQAAFTVTQGIRDNLEELVRGASNTKVANAVMGQVSRWWVDNSTTIDAWVKLSDMGVLTDAAFIDRLRDNLLEFEIALNATRMRVTNQRNRDRKTSNTQTKPQLIVSTIHGAKGMEFDNVVVLYKEDTAMSEESRRMYYVAFTRAMKSQFVLSYGKVKNPPIQANYEQIVAALTKRDEQHALMAAGLDPDQVAALADADAVDAASAKEKVEVPA